MTPTSPVTVSSLKSLRMEDPATTATAQKELSVPISQPANWRGSFHMSDAAIHRNMSMRSLASIGMGSTDGRKVTIRRVPTSPSELLNIVTLPMAGRSRFKSRSGVLRMVLQNGFLLSFHANSGSRSGYVIDWDSDRKLITSSYVLSVYCLLPSSSKPCL
uniref:Uncharacterized protein n=1 Tax=Timema douglasi TaxID=61478 RepID=A0A7R8VL69_TIMDO|nr:unnamed protein product [Timema douglasi]